MASAARSRALRARGFRSISLTDGRITRRVSVRNVGLDPEDCSRKNCLTIRSSSEWKAITTSRPPILRMPRTWARNEARRSNSRLTSRRIAWNTRVAG